jgi:hypothetical protein
MLTQEELWALLDYNPETGVFTWKFTFCSRAVKGTVAGTTNGGGYQQIRIHGKIYASHRLAFLWMTGSFPEEYVDHINHDKQDNRWCNLRKATAQQNMQNRKKLCGVRRRGGVFTARIHHNGKEIYLGCFPNLADAVAARVKAATEIFNDFAPFSQVGI